MGRHRHVACVRTDGLSAILRPLLDDARVVGATLVDVGSGLVLDGFADTEDLGDLELVGAGHAEMVAAAAMLRGDPHGRPDTGVTVDTGDGRLHVVASVADPHGDHLVVAVVVRGAARHAARVRRRLREVPVEALTAGPSNALRPVDGRWLPASEPTGVAAGPSPDPGGDAPIPVPHPTAPAWSGPRPDGPAWTLSELSGSAWSSGSPGPEPSDPGSPGPGSTAPGPSGPGSTAPGPSGPGSPEPEPPSGSGNPVDGDDAPADDREDAPPPGPVAPAPPAAMIPGPVLPPVADALRS